MANRIKTLFKTPEQFAVTLLISSGVAALVLMFGFTRLARRYVEATNGEAFHPDSYADGTAVGYVTIPLGIAVVYGVALAGRRAVSRLWPGWEPGDGGGRRVSTFERWERLRLKRERLEIRRLQRDLADDDWKEGA